MNMLQERFAIYCFSLEKTLFAPVRYSTDGSQPLIDVLVQAAWINQVLDQNGGTPPENFSAAPSDFLPKILSYSKLEPINKNLTMGSANENVFVVLMPDSNIDLKVLELVLDSKYRDYMKEKGITVAIEQKDVLHLKPTFMGMGIDLKALWKKFF